MVSGYASSASNGNMVVIYWGASSSSFGHYTALSDDEIRRRFRAYLEVYTRPRRRRQTMPRRTMMTSVFRPMTSGHRSSPTPPLATTRSHRRAVATLLRS